MYIGVAGAPFFSPYSHQKKFEGLTYHPPNARFYSRELGLGLQAQKYVLVNTVSLEWRPLRGEYEKVRWLARGDRYSVLGLSETDIHLFTTQDYPLFIFGADHLGRDLLSRIIVGGRISLTIGLLGSLISLSLAILLGGLAGYYGGTVDWLIMRVCEFMLLIPGLYLLLFLRQIFLPTAPPGQTFVIISLILSLIGFPGSARLVRGIFLSIKEENYILSARLDSVPSIVIVFRHMLPHLYSILLISLSFSIPAFILGETALSYLGLGITDPSVSWGSLLSRRELNLRSISAFPWILMPGIFIILAGVSYNILAEHLRDFLDPYINPVFVQKKATTTKKKQSQKQNQKPKRELGVENTPFPENNTEKGIEQEEQVIQADHIPKPTASLYTDTLLSVRKLGLCFGSQSADPALQGFDMDIKRGEVLGIVGESGSGKSVSMLGLLGLLKYKAHVSYESIYMNNTPIDLDYEKDVACMRSHIAYVYQEPSQSYDPLVPIDKHFLETFRVQNPSIDKDEARLRSLEILSLMQIDRVEERIHSYFHQFSGGMIQRVQIALALANNPDILVADEITTALDVITEQTIMDLLIDICKTRSMAMICISHDIGLIGSVADRIAVMQKGRLVECDKTSTILNKPKAPYTKTLLGSQIRFGDRYDS